MSKSLERVIGGDSAIPIEHAMCKQSRTPRHGSYQSIAGARHRACVGPERTAGAPMTRARKITATAVRHAEAKFRQHVMTPPPGSHIDWHDMDSWVAAKFPALDEDARAAQ
jgi:hypothetical protein